MSGAEVRRQRVVAVAAGHFEHAFDLMADQSAVTAVTAPRDPSLKPVFDELAASRGWLS
jgi:hypothetical protein